jgi:hypothetical protein
VARERTNAVETEAPAARRAGGLAQSAARFGDQLPEVAQLLLSLQQSAGNRAVTGLVQRWRSAEAGRQGTLAPVQRERLEEEEPLQGRFAPVQFQGIEEEELQLRAARPEPPQRTPEPVPRRNETGLPDGLKSGVESLSGISLDEVEVHYNSAEPARLNALAYAQGTDIHVGPGQEQHLPHEAWHVVQQAQGRVQPTMQLQHGVPVSDDQELEHEADAMGAMASSLISPSELTPATVQAAEGTRVAQRVPMVKGEFVDPTPAEGTILKAQGSPLQSEAFMPTARFHLIPENKDSAYRYGEYRQDVKGAFRTKGVANKHGLKSGAMSETEWKEDQIGIERYGYREGRSKGLYKDDSGALNKKEGRYFDTWDQPKASENDDEVDLHFRGRLIDTGDSNRDIAVRHWHVYGVRPGPGLGDAGASGLGFFEAGAGLKGVRLKDK